MKNQGRIWIYVIGVILLICLFFWSFNLTYFLGFLTILGIWITIGCIIMHFVFRKKLQEIRLIFFALFTLALIFTTYSYYNFSQITINNFNAETVVKDNYATIVSENDQSYLVASSKINYVDEIYQLPFYVEEVYVCDSYNDAYHQPISWYLLVNGDQQLILQNSINGIETKNEFSCNWIKYEQQTVVNPAIDYELLNPFYATQKYFNPTYYTNKIIKIDNNGWYLQPY